MSIPSQPLVVLHGIIWIVCLLLGAGLGIIGGRSIGTFLGWMIANSLDMSMRRGGRFGRQVGALVGAMAGIGFGVYGALHLVVFTTQLVPPR